MEYFFSEIENCIKAGLFYSALIDTLVLPDICAALSAKNGKSSRKKYEAWFNDNISSQIGLNAKDCYSFRCSMVHEGGTHHISSDYNRIGFTAPSKMKIHGPKFIRDGVSLLILDLGIFCNTMINGGREWYSKNQTNEYVIQNYAKLFDYDIDGLPYFIKGIPILK